MQYRNRQTGEIVEFHGEISGDHWEEVKAPSSDADDVNATEDKKKRQPKAVKK